MTDKPTGTGSDTTADLIAQCQADYGTPQEREDRANEARAKLGDARVHASEAAGGWRGSAS